MPSTPKHVFMYEAFEWAPPVYAHVGLLQDNHRQKFSKRAGDLDFFVRTYEARGIFAEALINYLALFGWSHRQTDDFSTIQDLIESVWALSLFSAPI